MLKRDELTALVRKAQAMDPDAMNTLFEECRDPIYYFALKTLQDQDAAEDATQEAMIDIFRNLDKLKDPVAFQAWSREITYRQCLRYIKKTPDILVSEDEEGYSIFDTLEEENQAFIPDAAMESKEFQKTVQDMVNSLPAEQRAAILLYHFDGLSVKEIASIQQVPENTVKSRLMYGRKAIKASVESYEKKTGVKLHSFALTPFIFWFFTQEATVFSMPASLTVATATGIATATGVSVSAGTTSAGVATAAVAKASVPVVAKVAAGVAAVGVAAGGVAVAMGLFDDKGFDSPQYESPYMEIYGNSDQFQQDFKGVLGGERALYIQTKDGQLFSVSDPETDMLEGCEVEKVISADNTIGYVGTDGVTYLWTEGAYRPLPGLKGEVIHSRNGLGGAFQVFTLDGKQVYSSLYNTDSDVIEEINTPFTVEEGFDEIDEIHFTTRYYLLDHETCYYARSGEKQMLGAYTTFFPLDHHRHTPYTVEEKPVTVIYLAGRYCGSADSPLFAVEGDPDHIYYSYSYGADLNTAVALPDGKKVSDIKQALFSEDVFLLFNDGTVYRHQTFHEGFEKLDHISDLGKKGHIKKIYLSDDPQLQDLVCLMDDNVLYRYVIDPDIPEPTQPETAPPPKNDWPSF